MEFYEVKLVTHTQKYMSSRLKAINVFNYIFRSQKTSNPSEKIYLKIYSNGKEMRFDDKQ